MRLLKRNLLMLPLFAASLNTIAGCSGEKPAVATSSDRLEEAKKLRAASLSGEAGGLAPRSATRAKK
jgi:hypothetical protein